MDRGLRERVRWGNVARAAGVVGVVVLVVMWPVVAPEGPRVAVPRAVPVATPTPGAVAPAVVRPRARRVVRGERRAGDGGGGSRRRRPRAAVTPAARPAVRPAPGVPRRAAPEPRGAPVVPRAAPEPRAAPVVPPAAGEGSPAPADPDPVLREFSFEGG